jgi:HK97 family phage major capsid protein
MTPEQLSNIFEERNRVAAELQSLHSDADGRALTAEETQTEVRLNGDLDGFQSRMVSGIKDMARETEADEARARFEKIAPREEERAAEPDQDSDAEKARRLFAGEIRAAEFEAPERRDLLAETGTDGQELVPQSMYTAVHEYLTDASTIMQTNATVIRTSGGGDLEIPRTTAYSAAALVAEAGSIGESDPQFSTITLGAYKYGFMTQASSELLQDSAFDVVGFLARQGGMALGNGIGAALITGTGSAQPKGVDLATVGVTAAAVGAVTSGELIDLQHSVLAAYRRNATFIMNDSTLRDVRKLADDNGNFLWRAGLEAGAPDMLLGSPVATDPNIAAMGAAALAIVYGDLSGYYTRLAGAVRIERSDDFAFANDLITFRFIQRADGDIVDTVGIRVLKMAAS